MDRPPDKGVTILDIILLLIIIGAVAAAIAKN